MPSARARNATAEPAEPAGGKTIKDLVSYRIHRLANALSRGAALRYRQGFDVSLMEWRILALLGDFAPLTLKDLAKESGLDKSQASRAVADLVQRGLVLREIGREDAREVALRLSSAGRRSYAGLIAAARDRDAAFQACLSEEERRVVDSALRKLEAEARRLVALAEAEEVPGAAREPRRKT
ncbi:MAG TPA: MarR family transcriptional regulator [Falsiroseomonas sp.]|jgi:DNA-binding MarR family transcriptional regulator|nr:MarR family transcriptional regulator [Falsiroseomonas sp.]